MHKSFIKILSILLIIGLNWTGLSAVIETVAYYNDTEDSNANTYQAGTLDFSLYSPNDFLPKVMPEQSANREINVSNDGSLGFQYGVQSAHISGALCGNLILKADLEGNNVYTGTIAGFNYNAGEFSDLTDNWQFTASLTSDDSSLENQICNFDFIFDGVQIGGVGFSDQETISNTIYSGEWREPTTSGYSPIADSYVSEVSPNSNYGGSGKLQVRSKNCSNPLENKRTFIKFDFHFPEGTVINSAVLKLYMKDAPSKSRTYELKKVLESWKERDPNGIDWNNQPSVGDLTDSVATGDSNPKWLEWDVTRDVQKFVDGTYSNYGWRINDSIESEHTGFQGKFYSRESNDTDKRPILEITFEAPEVDTDYPVINEVYYDVANGKGNDPNNEWVEIYNPTDSEIDISGWKICEAGGCDIIPSTISIPAKGFAVASGKSSTWEDYWTLPAETITIDLPGYKIGKNGLNDNGDRVILKNASNTIIDAMSYGDDHSQLNPSLPLSGKGKSLARIIKGYDTDLRTDWIINATPNPGTNPSIGGVETVAFTYQGIEFEGGELAPEDDGISNDLPEEEDIVEEKLIESPLIIIDGFFVGAPLTPVQIEESAIEPEPELVIEEQPTTVSDDSSSNPEGTGESVSDEGNGNGGGDASGGLDSDSSIERVGESSGEVGDADESIDESRIKNYG